MSAQISRLRLLGLLFCLAGGAAITFGWAGTAQVTCVDCQVPYLISGGAGGVALVVLGTGLLVIAQLRIEGNRIAERLAVRPPSREPESEPGPTDVSTPTTRMPTVPDRDLADREPAVRRADASSR